MGEAAAGLFGAKAFVATREQRPQTVSHTIRTSSIFIECFEPTTNNRRTPSATGSPVVRPRGFEPLAF